MHNLYLKPNLILMVMFRVVDSKIPTYSTAHKDTQ